MAVSSPISINLSFVMRLTNAPTLWSVASTSQAMRSPGEPPKAAACLMHKSAETRIPNMVGCGHGQSCVPFQARILGCNLRRGLQGESASHSERQFRDAVSALSKRPRLTMELGPKAQLIQLMASANGSQQWSSALYSTRGDERGCTAYPPWQIRTQLAVECAIGVLHGGRVGIVAISPMPLPPYATGSSSSFST